MLSIASILGSFAGCSDDDGGSDNNGGGNTPAQTLEWPEGFLYLENTLNSTPGTNYGAYNYNHNNKSGEFTFTKNNVHGNGQGFTPYSINGKIITVKCESSSNSNFKVGNLYMLCTNYEISGNTITMYGSKVLPTYGDASTWPAEGNTVELTRFYK